MDEGSPPPSNSRSEGNSFSRPSSSHAVSGHGLLLMMVTMTHVNLELSQLPEAERLADLAGIADDLRACRTYCETQLKRKPISNDFGAELRDSSVLTIAAFVSYARCFKSGVRSATQRELEASILSADQKKQHKTIIALRDMFVAHSVNDLERHRLLIWMFPPGSREAIWGVTIETERLATPPPPIFQDIIALCGKHLKWIEAETQKEAERLKAILQDRYSTEQIYAFGKSPPSALNFTNLEKGRKRRKR